MILNLRNIVILSLTFLLFFSTLLFADNNKGGYQLPPQPIIDVVDAPWTPRISISPNKEWMLLRQYPGLPGIEEVSQPELRLAGFRINPVTNGPSRGWYLTEMKLKKISDGTEYEITGMPTKPHYTNVSFSPKGDKVAFINTDDNGLTLWCISIDDKKAWQVTNTPLNGVSGSPFSWLDDEKIVVCALVDGRGDLPAKPTVPSGPIIQENMGRKAPARTYQDLLKNEYDESVFEYFLTSQIVVVSLDGKTTPISNPGLYTDVTPSPGGKYLLVEQLHKPFSYTVPYHRFPIKSDVLDIDGNLIYAVADLPLAEEIPIAYGSVKTGRRSINWRADTDATLYWAEARDGGDAGVEADERDELFMFKAPFDKTPVSLITIPLRFDGIKWGDNNLALVSAWWWKTRNIRVWSVMPGKPDAKPELITDRSWEDKYNDPGSPMMKRNKQGWYVLLTGNKGKSLYLTGTGASPEGNRPFVREFNIKTQKITELFRSEAPYYESPIKFFDDKKQILLTSRESVTDQPNYYIRDLKNGTIKQVTEFPHPSPQLKDVQKELIQYEREDGVKLSGTLYLPAGYKTSDGPLPMLMWAYPIEFKSAAAASQLSDSPYRFVRVSWASPMMWLSMGYAVLDDPTMPIIGEGEAEPNDSFRNQLVSSAQAAIDEVVKRGVADRDRIAIGGHSYGAFMTGNLLAHSDLFRLGIARSGAYNRTLTPFGFQSEDRTLWEAPDIYFAMSPFMHADKINEPILLIHGEADNNSGTYPLQSERFYSALKGHGARVKLIMLPHESHGYKARESVMHMLYETANWLDMFVKNAEPRTESSEK
ncbi:MAG: S9 family peptidase [candidate division Zixibacteria bacterium]|nr:S9 family peptidase [candidate division Zixibacteria bacterium]